MDRYEEYREIKNEELQEILKFVTEEPIFFGDEKRLLSKSEIINYKDELNIDLNEDIIPLIDLCDNNFLIYNISKNKFQMMDISDDIIWKDVDSIHNYINEIYSYIKEEHDKQVGDGSRYPEYFKEINGENKTENSEWTKFRNELSELIDE